MAFASPRAYGYGAQMGPDALDQIVDDLRLKIEAKMRIRSADLDQQLRKAGRSLPRNIRKDAQAVAQAHLFLRSPRMSRRVDVDQAIAAQGRVMTYLDTLNPRDAMQSRWVYWGGGLVLNLILLAILVGAFLYWQGLI